MSKAKKQKPEDEKVKLDMSFDDAIRLAMKTPPMVSIDLPLNEEKEIIDPNGKHNYSGRIISFRQMFVEPADSEKVSNFYVEIRRSSEAAIKRIMPTIRQGTNEYAAFFTWSDNEIDPGFQIKDKERVFLTLRIINENIKTEISYCRVSYTLAVRFPD